MALLSEAETEQLLLILLTGGQAACRQTQGDVGDSGAKGGIVAEVAQPDNPHYAWFRGCYDWHSCVHGYWACVAAADWLAHYGSSNAAATLDTHSVSPPRARTSINDALESITGLNHEEGQPGGDAFASLRRELVMLGESQQFEMPYGRAWLLRLLVCMERTSSCGSGVLGRGGVVVEAMQVASSLKGYLVAEFASHSGSLRQEPEPMLSSSYAATREYRNPCWVLLHLHLFARYLAKSDVSKEASEGRSLQDWVEQQVQGCFFLGTVEAPEAKRARFEHVFESDVLLPMSASAPQQTAGPGFFSVWSVQCLLILRVLGAEKLRVFVERDARPYLFTSLEEIAPVRDGAPDAGCSSAFFEPIDISVEAVVVGDASNRVHLLGLNASRAWGFWALTQAFASDPDRLQSRQAYQRCKSAYIAHVREAISLEEIEHWGTSQDEQLKVRSCPGSGCISFRRYAYSHWVPQFAVYALLLGASGDVLG